MNKNKKYLIYLIIVLSGIIFTCGCVEEIIEKPTTNLKPSLSNIATYANTYEDYAPSLFEDLAKFDIVVIEPYGTPKEAVDQLRSRGVIVLAYIDIGEAEEYRVYWEKMDRSLILSENPDWHGCYYADVNNPKWHDIIIDTEIPYILELGDYDGLCMDMLDVVDEYPELKPGMISLVKKIREKYPNLILVPNRGFEVLDEIAQYIDAFKYEEMNGMYDSENKRYSYTDWDDDAELEHLLEVLQKQPMPVLVLDHIRTDPEDEEMARHCYERTKQISNETGYKFIWYGNSVEQNLPEWSFL